MIIDVDVKESKEFFRVKKILDELKSSPDYQKDRVILLISMASKLYKEIADITDISKISAYRFSGTKIVNSDLTEQEVVKETIKAIEEQMNTDMAVQNLSALVRFWKGVSKEREVYKPLLEELISLLDETRVYLQETKQVQALKESIKNYEGIINGLKDQIKNNEKLIKDKDVEGKHWKNAIRPLLDNINILNEHIKMKSQLNPLTTPDLNLFTDVLIYLILEGGRGSIEEIAYHLAITQEKVKVIQQEYKDYIELSPSGEMVGIIDKKEYRFNIDSYMDRQRVKSEEEKQKMIKQNEEEQDKKYEFVPEDKLKNNIFVEKIKEEGGVKVVKSEVKPKPDKKKKSSKEGVEVNE